MSTGVGRRSMRSGMGRIVRLVSLIAVLSVGRRWKRARRRRRSGAAENGPHRGAGQRPIRHVRIGAAYVPAGRSVIRLVRSGQLAEDVGPMDRRHLEYFLAVADYG